MCLKNKKNIHTYLYSNRIIHLNPTLYYHNNIIITIMVFSLKYKNNYIIVYNIDNTNYICIISQAIIYTN